MMPPQPGTEVKARDDSIVSRMYSRLSIAREWRATGSLGANLRGSDADTTDSVLKSYANVKYLVLQSYSEQISAVRNLQFQGNHVGNRSGAEKPCHMAVEQRDSIAWLVESERNINPRTRGHVH